MGLFSKTVLHQASQTMVLIEDTPDLLKPAIIQSTLGGDDLVASMMNNVLNSFSMNVDQYHSYGRQHYTNGLPEGTIGSLAVNAVDTQEVIDRLFPPAKGNRNRIDVSVVDTFEVSWFVKETLRNTTDWNPETDTITLPAYPQYTMIHPENYNTLRLNDTRFQVAISVGDHLGTLRPIPMTTDSKYKMIVNRQYYYVSWTELDEDSNPVGYQKFWVYDPTSGDVPELPVEGTVTEYTQYLPIVPLRINNVSLTDEKHSETELYKTSKKLLSKINLDIAQLGEGINSNPDIGSIDHAYVVMGISIWTEKPDSKAYLYAFFDDLEDKSEVSKEWFEFIESDTLHDTPPPCNTIYVEDGTYKTQIIYNWITKESAKGSVGKVGTVEVDIKYGFGRITRGDYGYENSLNQIILKKQITENSYDIITVAGAAFINNIYGGRQYFTNLAPSDEDNFIIPINISVANQFSLVKRNAIYYDAMRIVFHAYEYQKLKWYQTGFFKIVTVVIAVAVTVVTGFDWGITSLLAAASAGAVALLSHLAIQATIALIVQVGFKFATEKLGFEIALILAAAMMVVGYGGGMFDLPYATQLTNIGMIGMSTVGQVGAEMLQEDYLEFSTYADEKTKELEAAQDLLVDNSLSQMLDPTDLFTNIGMLPNERPEAFYRRSLTVDTGNLSIEYLHSFYDTMLELPHIGRYE